MFKEYFNGVNYYACAEVDKLIADLKNEIKYKIEIIKKLHNEIFNLKNELKNKGGGKNG